MPARVRRTASETERTASFLADEPLAELRLEVQELLRLALSEPVDRDARPLGHDGGDVVLRDRVVDHPVLDRVSRLGGLERSLDAGDRLVVEAATPSGSRPARMALSSSMRASLSCILRSPTPRERGLLGLPARLEPLELPRALGEIGRAAWRAAPSTRRPSSFLSASSSIRKAVDGALELVDLDGRAVDLHLQAGGRLVDEVDGLVGQLAPRDVAVAEGRRGDECGIP